MYKHLSRPRRSTASYRSTSFLAGLTFLALSIVAPAQVEKAETRIFSRGLSVTLEKSSPAFAALEDDLHSPISAEEIAPNKTAKPVQIFSGENFSAKASAIAADNKREEQLTLQKQMSEANRVQVVEVSREELLQSLFLPLVMSLKKAPEFQSKAPVQTAHNNSPAGHYEQVANQTPAVPPQTIAPDTSIDPNQPHLIRGLIEFTNGLALTSATDEIKVFQEVEGEEWQKGNVWLKEARYEIEIPNREGLLVAELRSEAGELLGRGEIELANLPLKKATQYKVSDVTIRLHPMASGLSGTVLSAYSHNDVKKPVSEAQIEIGGVGHQLVSEKDGRFEDPEVMADSSIVVKIQRAGYWGTLAVATSKSENVFTLYPNKMLKAFMSFVKSNDPSVQLDQDSSLVWGRVTRNGKAVAGAHVDLMTTDKPLSPIYFNELMIPDPKLTATSSNGLYAFLPVPPGAHALQVTDQNILSEPVVFPTEARNVSTIDVETISSKRMLIKTFDAFTPTTPINAQLYRLGFEQERQTTRAGVAELKYVPSTTLLVVNAVPTLRDYVPVRVSVTRNRTYAYFPMINVKWLKSAIGGRRNPGSAIAVGFVKSNKPYQVFPDVGASATVIYFDPQGNIASSGVPGGGYIVFNLDNGFRTISVVPIGGEKVSAQTIMADSKFVNVINHAIQ